MAAAARPETTYDVIVVGLGAHGSSALYHLARRGLKVLGLESQAQVAHSMGSSHGLTRIIRLAYFEDPSYVPLLREAFALWAALEEESGQPLLTKTGCLNVSLPGTAQGPGGVPNCFSGALASALRHSLEHEVLDADAVNARFPAFQVPPGTRALFEPSAGYLHPEAGIRAHIDCARRRGAEVVCGARVQRWEVVEQPGGGGGSGSLVRVHTGAGIFQGRKVILAGGAWMPVLVPELKSLLTVERQVVGWFGVEPGAAAAHTPQRLPVWLLDDERIGYFYGFPADAQGLKLGKLRSNVFPPVSSTTGFPADDTGLKLGKYNHLGGSTSADGLDREVHPEDEAALRLCLERYLPQANGRMNRSSVCMFTNSTDGHFLLDFHPKYGSTVVLSSACSGHGYKFSSVIGAILADLAAEGSTRRDIALHRLGGGRPGHEAFIAACKQAGPASRL